MLINILIIFIVIIIVFLIIARPHYYNHLFLHCLNRRHRHVSPLSGAATEVTVGEEAPAVVTPLKPKLYLMGSVAIDPGHAVQVK